MADFAETIYVSRVDSHKYTLYWEVIDLATDLLVDNNWYGFSNHDELWEAIDEQGFDPEELFAKLDASNNGEASLTDEF
jgi:hypothetical protein